MTYKEDWYRDCFIHWDSRFQDLKGLNVLIARKAPRMVDYEIANKYLKETSLAPIVSEHALPFMLSADYPGISVIDDAIYYGTTFENVVSWLKTVCYFTGKEPLSNKKLRAEPVVRAKNAKTMEHIDLYHVEVIPDKYVPYYIERLTSSFLELGKPFDIEFPILYFEKPENFLTSPEEICKTLKDIFAAEVYSVDHRQGDEQREEEGNKFAKVNYSIIFSSSLLSGNSNVEFAKFRLFVGEEKICLTSYAPSVFPEEILAEASPLFAGTLFEPLWKKAYVPSLQEMEPPAGSSYQDYLLKNYKIEKLNQYQWEYQCEEAELFRKRSLMILANYFCSFGLLLEKKVEIDRLGRTWGCHTCGLDKKDLQLIFGPELAETFCAALNPYLTNNKAFEKEQLPSHTVLSPDFLEFMTKDVIPDKYVDLYYSENEQGWRHSRNLSESLSCMFSNMHFHIEKASRGSLPNTFERLRFGVSYDSMYYNLSRKQKHKIDGHMSVIHRWIDKKIDQGSVVPKYDRVQYQDTYYWRRLFRAGENEDKYLGQLARIAIFIFENVCRELEEDYIERDFIENIFAVIFSDKLFDDISLSRLGKIKWEVPERTGTSYRAAFYNDGATEPTYLVDYLLRMQIFKETEEYTSYVSIMKTTIVNELANGTTLEEKTEKRIVDYIKILICLFRNNSSFEKMQATINRIMIPDYAPYVQELELWKKELAIPFVEFMQDHPTSEIENYKRYPEFVENINGLFLKSYSISSKEISSLCTNASDKILKLLGKKLNFKLPKDDVPSKIYWKNLYAMYNLSQLIEAIYSFNDKEYVAFIVKKMKDVYPQFAQKYWEDFELNYTRYKEDKNYFFNKAQHLICYYENINQGSVNEGDPIPS